MGEQLLRLELLAPPEIADDMAAFLHEELGEITRRAATGEVGKTRVIGELMTNTPIILEGAAGAVVVTSAIARIPSFLRGRLAGKDYKLRVRISRRDGEGATETITLDTSQPLSAATIKSIVGRASEESKDNRG